MRYVALICALCFAALSFVGCGDQAFLGPSISKPTPLPAPARQMLDDDNIVWGT